MTITLLFTFTKVIIPFLINWFKEYQLDKGKRKNNHSDFNRLVENKKAMLRGDTSPGPSTIQSKKDKEKSQTLKFYKKLFEDLSKNSNRSEIEDSTFNDTKSILALFDGLQWGQSEEIQILSQQLSKKVGVRVNSTHLVSSLKVILKRDWAFSRKSQKLPSKKEFYELIELFIFWDFLIKELWNDEKPLHKVLIKKIKINQSELENSIIVALQKRLFPTTKVETLLIDVLNNKITPLQPDKLEASFLKILLSFDQKFFTSRIDWIKEILEHTEFFSSLSPLPPLKNDRDLKGAYLVLGIDEKTSFEQTKKVYRKLAIQKHPDKLSSKGIPKEFESIATENFALIQRAYDILKKAQ